MTVSKILRRQWVMLLLLALVAFRSEPASAQITVPRNFGDGRDAVASLEEQLVNRLRATTDQQRAFLHRVAVLVREGKLEQRLVVAVYRYSLKRHPHFPFPFFERAMRYESRKRGVDLPSVHMMAVTPELMHRIR